MKEFIKKRVVQDAFLYTLTNIVIQISSFIGVLFVSRYLGPTNLGIYSFVQNYIAGFVTILSGLDMYAHWNIVQKKNYYSELLLYTKQKAIITGILILFFVLFSYTYLPQDVFWLSLLLVVPIITSIFSGFIFVAQYENNTTLLTRAMMISAVLILVLKLAAVYLALPLSVFVAINSLDGVLIAVLCVAYLRTKDIQDEVLVVTIQNLLLLVRKGVLPLIYVFAWFVVVRVDQFFVPVYFDAYTLGVYSAAVKVIEMTNVLVVIMQAVIIPRVMLLQNPHQDMSRTNISVLVYGLAGFVAAAAIYVLAPIVTRVIFGESFGATASILRVYTWSIPGLFVSYLFAVIAMSKKSYKVLAISSVGLALLGTTLSLAASRSGDILLVASVSVAVYSVSAVLFYALWRKGLV